MKISTSMGTKASLKVLNSLCNQLNDFLPPPCSSKKSGGSKGTNIFTCHGEWNRKVWVWTCEKQLYGEVSCIYFFRPTTPTLDDMDSLLGWVQFVSGQTSVLYSCVHESGACYDGMMTLKGRDKRWLTTCVCVSVCLSLVWFLSVCLLPRW